MPRAFSSATASRTPFSIVRPRYGVRENGAFTTTSSDLPWACLEEPPQAARRTSARRNGAGRRTLELDGRSIALRRHAARFQGDDPVRDPPHDAEVVLDDEQTAPVVAER